jgi:hypothetical protein
MTIHTITVDDKAFTLASNEDVDQLKHDCAAAVLEGGPHFLDFLGSAGDRVSVLVADHTRITFSSVEPVARDDAAGAAQDRWLDWYELELGLGEVA